MHTVLIGEFAHETNTFSTVPTTLDHFRQRLLLHGEDIRRLQGTNCEIAGFLAAAAAHGWRLIPTVATAAGPGGLVTAEAFATLSAIIVTAARDHPEADGILLALHGAMVAEGHDDGEGELLARIRAAVGRPVPLAITLDLHANVSDRMAGLADIIVSYRTYPHIDMRERGEQAGGLLERAMAGAIRPHTVVARRAMVEGADHGRSEGRLMRDLNARARALEAEPGVLAVSINGGFGDADILDAGPSVTVTGDGESPRFRAMADGLMDEIWARRDETSVTYITPEDAASQAKAHPLGGRPLVIADYADNPGGGAYGDATGLLRALLDAKLENAAFGCLRDPEAVSAMAKAGIGAQVSLSLGGKGDPAKGGGPLAVAGTVVHLGDGRFRYGGPMHEGMDGNLGPTAVLRVGGLDIIVDSYNVQVLDREIFASQGIDARAKSVVAVKSMHHFRGAFAPIADRIIVADCGALCSPDPRKRPYRKLRRPIHPLDSVAVITHAG
ncbi:MAG: M81 family peptidase [Alphaproteobacteria bacterium]|nr:M81 family peptidase [Alphaproteobacteria bacterium]